MSKLSELHSDLETIRQIMAEPVLSAEDQMERRCDSIIRDLDELVAFAANPETVDLVQGQRFAIDQMKSRADLIVSFLMSRQPRPRVVSNNG